jgi:hypothetical protein
LLSFWGNEGLAAFRSVNGTLIDTRGGSILVFGQYTNCLILPLLAATGRLRVEVVPAYLPPHCHQRPRPHLPANIGHSQTWTGYIYRKYVHLPRAPAVDYPALRNTLLQFTATIFPSKMPRDLGLDEKDKEKEKSVPLTESPNSTEFETHSSEEQQEGRFVLQRRTLQDRANTSQNLHPYTRPLTISDLESCVALEEAAFPEHERCSREKVSSHFPFITQSSHSGRFSMAHVLCVVNIKISL